MDTITKTSEESLYLYIIATAAVIYAGYYLFVVVKKPFLACGDPKLKRFIHTQCPIVHENFWPTWWCFEGRSQTVLRFLIQSHPHVNYIEEHLGTPDGGEVRIDWEENETSTKFPKDTRPTILLLPGLTGNSYVNYICHMVHDALEMGYRCVVSNNRGTIDGKLKTPRTYCAANTEDTELVIQHIKNKYPHAPLIGVGISLGGMILFNYCSKLGPNSLLDSVMCISVGWNVPEAIDSLDKPVNYYLFNRTLAYGLVNMVKRNLHIFENHHSVDTAHVLRSSSIKDFDERFTSKVFGYDSVDHLYSEATLHTKLHTLATPILCLSASDDPFAPHHAIPIEEAEQNQNIAIVVTSRGGHIGFLEGMLPRHRNYMYRWFKQFVSASVEHGLKRS